MREVSSLPIGEEPEVGQVYLVKCLDLREINLPDTTNERMHTFRDNQHHLTSLPIIGNVHTDPEFPGAGGELPHIHMDIRFLTRWEFKTLWGMSPEMARDSYSPSFPILPNNSGVELPTPHLHPKTCNYKIGDYRRLQLAGHKYYSKFEDEMEKHTLNLNKPICPHHGTNLSGQPIRNGSITCPTHGLNFCAKTGALKRKTDRF